MKMRLRDLELLASQETWHQREEATEEDMGLFVDPVQKKHMKESKWLRIIVMESSEKLWIICCFEKNYFVPNAFVCFIIMFLNLKILEKW